MAVCIVIDPNKDLELINSQCEYGVLIGPGNTKLNSLLKGVNCFAFTPHSMMILVS